MADDPYLPPADRPDQRSAVALQRRANILLISGGVGIVLGALCGNPTLTDVGCFGGVVALAAGGWHFLAAQRAASGAE